MKNDDCPCECKRSCPDLCPWKRNGKCKDACPWICPLRRKGRC